MKRFYLTLLCSTFLMSSPCSAQFESSFSSLLNVPSARFQGMAQSGIGLTDDASANRLNPAALAFFRGYEIGVSHTNWLPQLPQTDLFLDALTTSNHFKSLSGTLSATIVRLDLGEFHTFDEQNNDLGVTHLSEFNVAVGYSVLIHNELGLGLNLRYIHDASKLTGSPGTAGTANTVGIDIGCLWRPSSGDMQDRIGIGAVLSNVGPKITWIDAAMAERLPTKLGFGLGYRLLATKNDVVNCVVDLSRILLAGYKVTLGIGAEYWYGNPKLLALRVGYTDRNSDSVDNSFTFGTGLRYGVFGLDVNFTKPVNGNQALGETWFLTLYARWGE